ncbi:uncharacterized protein PV07_03083 [Cladophialophora immunda]|uniref:BZIP domain-containing protein n=1 Tax=Cladophialophora immunda TaxID=569365 RepID=A0A0D2CJU9_9EURO|nr:uncharacterized protein PV07_03083 [Cladophialophora immunda]KIW31433.1 hypothetical protein PV07_03083 [Cladophialophora immunda]OQV08870.1 hypothetical protein CLAIMM_13084 [Cladophialophora immunda]
MMSVATEIIHQTNSEIIQIVAMSESGSEASKAAKKREYNRNAQRVFRQRRKEHLSKLEAAQRELNSIQVEEVERLRRENQALAQENESLKAAYGSQASSPGPTMSPGEVRGSPSGYMAYGAAPGGYLGPVSGAPSYVPGPVPVSVPQPATTPLSSASSDPSTLVVVVPNNIREIRRSLHQMFSPLLEIPVISNPQTHLATLAALEPSLPSSLKPSPLQLSTPHHAYIDMIPSPSLRDRLIAIGPANANTFLTEACTIACDIEDTGQMIVWGEDWLNEFSWEFSASVLERWGGWLLTSEWGQRANFWRRQRGVSILPGYD